jgi:hypothetical protein
MLLECLACGSDTQKNSRYATGAYQTGETPGTPSSSAVPMVMNWFESMTLRAIASSSSSSIITSSQLSCQVPAAYLRTR